jgi:hypothetical protein
MRVTRPADAIDPGRVAAGHDGQRARARPGRPAGHRRVDPARAAALFKPARHGARRSRLDGGQVDHQLIRPPGRRQAGRAEDDLFDRRGVGDADQDDVARSRQLGRGRGDCRSTFGEQRCPRRSAVEDAQWVAGVEHALGHRCADAAQSDEADTFRLLQAASPGGRNPG